MRNKIDGIGVISVLIYATIIISWIVNLIKLIQCDFASPFKEEVIHLLGVLVPPISLITVWL